MATNYATVETESARSGQFDATPDNDIAWQAWGKFFQSLNPFPKRKFSPMRPFKSLAIYIGVPCAALVFLGGLRGCISSEPLTNADDFQEFGHGVTTSFIAPAGSAAFDAGKTTLVSFEASMRYRERGNKPLTSREIKSLESFANRQGVVPISYRRSSRVRR